MKICERNNRGFTLIELLTVIGIMAITFALAIPSFMSIRPTWNVNSAARKVMLDMQLARVMAISKNMKHRVKFDSASNTFTIQEDTNRNNSWDVTDADIRSIDLPSGIQFGLLGGLADLTDGSLTAPTDTTDGIIFGTNNYVVFENRGTVEDTGAVYLIPSVDVADGREDRTRVAWVKFGATANTKGYRYTGSGWEDL